MDEDLFDVFESGGSSSSSRKPSSRLAGPESETLPGDVDLVESIIGESKAAVVDVGGPSGVKRGASAESDREIDGDQGSAALATQENSIKRAKMDVKVEEMSDGDGGDEETDDVTFSLVESAPRIRVHTIETASPAAALVGGRSCTHEVAVPPGMMNADEVEPFLRKGDDEEPAKRYAFELDPFQREAIACIRNDRSVLVSAHTSAGKTVVAEYAVAQSLKRRQRVIYTTPIKALSNQKYREFYEEFSDVGLVTGDVTINPSASCLIMTTEILRSMLYRGSEIMREVAWVIFDEIHYMRDKERGVVWEETIILLPDNVHYVFLSATIPNARQFAEWIAHLHKQPCHVVYTDFRPTPLQHYVFPSGGDGIHLVLDQHGKFREENFAEAMNVLAGGGDSDSKAGLGGDEKGKGRTKKRLSGNQQASNCYNIIKMIMERNFAPVIVFSFSKKECEAYALSLSKLDFNSSEEKKLVDEVFQNAMMVLSEEDRALPQVENVLPLLRRGIGIHHGGLLPILKETTEILFGEGLIKTLFATETFAMGLNMPARTVLFTSAQKFDGVDFRFVTSGEYIQMSGRAGRRGLDDKGIVILMVDEKMPAAVGRSLLTGAADHLNSAFHLTYNMVLNLLRVEEINPEYMMERSFHQFQNYSNIPKLFRDVKELEAQLAKKLVEDEADVASYFKLREQLTNLSKDFHSWLIKPQYLVKFLQPGRLVRVKYEEKDFGFGVVAGFKKKAVNKRANPAADADGPDQASSYIVDVLLRVTPETAKSQSPQSLVPAPGNLEGDSSSSASKGIMVVVSIDPTLIQQISSIRIFIPKDIRPLDSRIAVFKNVQQVIKKFGADKVPLLDPVEDMKIEDKAFKELIKRVATFEDRLVAHRLHERPDIDGLLEEYSAKAALAKDLEKAKAEVRKAKSLLQMEDLKKMKRVLRRLGYCSSSDVIEVKGRIACELSSADELLLTEMIFNGMFNEMAPELCAAVLSCFVCDEKTSEMPKLADGLSGPLKQMQDMARRIAKVSREVKIDLNEEVYLNKFKPYMMDVVHEWCKGATFYQLCKMTELFEGSIIRSMRRLEELLRQMVQAAKNIGNTELENKFSEAIRLIKRDIVFAASLYL